MNYEKRYNDALERATAIYQGGSYKPDIAATIAEILQNVFPEIKESEDERIRKHLISLVKNWDKGGIVSKYTTNPDDIKQILSWLEKQGKQKPIMDIPSREVILSIWDLGNEWKELTGGCISEEYGTQLDYIQKHWNESEYYLRKTQGKQETLCDKCRKEQPSHSCQDITALGRCAVEYEHNLANKVEPKFKVGYWIIWDNKILCHVDNIYQGKESLMYTITDTNGMTRSYSVKGFDKNAHLWTIQDAKDGDVLQLGEVTAIFKSYIGNGICKCYCSVCNGEFEIPIQNGDDDTYGCDDAIPATKEQRDLLFQKMKEAGYEWDAEKKEPKKTKQIFHEGDWIISSVLGTARIIGINNSKYLLEYIDGKQEYLSIDYVDYEFDKWTIKDARPGDVLVAPKIDGSEHSEQIFIFKEIKDRDYVKNAVEYYCRVVDGEFYVNEQCFMGQSHDHFVPATKEQRELLFQKMHESGYELLKSI